MKIKSIKALLSVIFLCFVFILAHISIVSAFSVKELLGLDKSESETQEETQKSNTTKENNNPDNKSKNEEWAKTADKAAPHNPQIDLDYVSLLFANMNEQERSKVLEDPALFKQVIESEANNRSVVSAAIANKMEQDKNVDFLMRRGAENILRESYLKRLIVSKLPNDFPSSEQIAEYYENNKSQFVIPERVHVWQIFFSKPKEKKDLTAIKKKAENIIQDIKKGKADFSNIALEQSEHEQSRILGGYMGLIKVTELLPEIKDALFKLKEGEISKAVESESGIHILKRGKILKSEQLELSQVESQIKKLIINQADKQLRTAIYTQAEKEFPQNVSDKKLEEWRLRLKTNTTTKVD